MLDWRSDFTLLPPWLLLSPFLYILQSNVFFPLQSGNFLLEKLPTVSLAQVAKYLIGDQTLIALFKISFKLAVLTFPFQISPTNI